MKRISLFAAILLFASVAGSAQKVRIIEGCDTIEVSECEIYDNKTKSFLTQQASIQRQNSNGVFNQILQELSRRKGVTAITVTKSLLDIIPEVHSYTEGSGVDIQKVIPKLEHIDVFKSKDDETKKFMRNSPIDIGSKALMRIKNEKEDIGIYGNIDGNNTIRSIIMFSDSGEECVLIRIMGTFDKNDLKQIIKIKGQK